MSTPRRDFLRRRTEYRIEREREELRRRGPAARPKAPNGTVRDLLLSAIRSGDEEQRRALLRRYQHRRGVLTRVADKMVEEGILERPETGPGYKLRGST